MPVHSLLFKACDQLSTELKSEKAEYMAREAVYMYFYKIKVRIKSIKKYKNKGKRIKKIRQLALKCI